jgi:hypothetical protein
VGLFLPQPGFSHGHLYVAFSRVTKMFNIKVQILEYENQGRLKRDKDVYTKNIVYKELIN